MRVNWKLNAWWDQLSASLLAGTQGLGVYLNGTGLTLVQLQKNFSGLQAQHLIFLPLEEGGMAALALKLQEFVADWGLESGPVSLAVSSEMGFVRQATLPRAAAENLAQVVAYELDRFLPLPADKLYFDFQVLEEKEDEIHLMLLALPREPVEVCLALLAEVGLKPMSLELAPTAVANAFAALGGKLPHSWLLLNLEPGAFQLTQVWGQTLGAFIQRSDLAPRDLPKILRHEMDRLRGRGPGPQSPVPLRQRRRRDRCRHHGPAARLGRGLPQPVPHPGAAAGNRADPGLCRPWGPPSGAWAKCPWGPTCCPWRRGPSADFGGYSSIHKCCCWSFWDSACLGRQPLVHKRVVLYQVNRQIAALETPEAKQVEGQLEESRALAKQMESLRKVGQSPDKLRVLKDLTTLIPDNTWLFNLHLIKQTLDISGMSRSASDLIPLLEKSGWLQKTEFASPIVTDANKLEHFKIKAEIKGLEPGS